MAIDWSQLGAWVVIAIAAVTILTTLLRIVGKMVATSLRVAIILGSLLVIAVALLVLSQLISQQGMPIL